MKKIKLNKKGRWLISHAESDDIFEVFTQKALEGCIADGCDDVTGVSAFEDSFRLTTQPKAVAKVVLKRKLQNDLQLLTDEEIELASIAATYYALIIPTFEDGYEWKGALEDAEWLAERGKLMLDGPFAWFNEEGFTREELDEYFAIKEAGPSAF